MGVQEEKKKPKQLLPHSFLAPLPKPRTPTPSEVREIKKANDRERVGRQTREAQFLNRCAELALKWGLPWGKDLEYKVSSNPIRKGAFGRKSLISKHEDDLYQAIRAIALGVKPVRTPVAIFGSLGVCIYAPASRHWLISYSPIHLI